MFDSVFEVIYLYVCLYLNVSLSFHPRLLLLFFMFEFLNLLISSYISYIFILFCSIKVFVPYSYISPLIFPLGSSSMHYASYLYPLYIIRCLRSFHFSASSSHYHLTSFYLLVYFFVNLLHIFLSPSSSLSARLLG